MTLSRDPGGVIMWTTSLVPLEGTCSCKFIVLSFPERLASLELASFFIHNPQDARCSFLFLFCIFISYNFWRLLQVLSLTLRFYNHSTSLKYFVFGYHIFSGIIRGADIWFELWFSGIWFCPLRGCATSAPCLRGAHPCASRTTVVWDANMGTAPVIV